MCVMARDGHFCQFLISISDRFQKRLIVYSGGGGGVMVVMDIIKISEDCYDNEW